MQSKEVVIIGGGVSGLSLAHYLHQWSQERGVATKVTIVEKTDRTGGIIRTIRQDGFTIEAGPDSWVANKPEATDLAKELGLVGSLIRTIESNRRVYAAWDGRLHPLPDGLILGVPTRVMPIAKTALFTWPGKIRMGIEPLVPRREWKDDDDESIASFVARRFGSELAERLVAPLLSGIVAGDAAELSIRSTFPQFVDAERAHGSLVMAMRKMRREREAVPKEKAPSPFVSLREGMGSLIAALEKRVESSAIALRKRADVTRIARDGSRFVVELANGEHLAADAVVIAATAHAAERIVRPYDAALADALAAIPYTSSATVAMAFERAKVAHPLDATGFIVPRASKRPMGAATWISSKWESRAPEGVALMRAFFGGAGGEATLAKSDDELIALARSELAFWMGPLPEPIEGTARVFRYDRSSPQPTIGHAVRLRAIREALARSKGLYVIGNGFDGIGVPSCVKQARAVATDLLGDAAVAPKASGF